jgi:uncharacterized phiE125 gp8 family phage protein
MTLILKTAPASEPVTLADMQAVMGIHDTSDTLRDSVIESRITAARMMAEEFTRKAIISQTWDLYAPCFRPYFDLKMNQQSVTSLKYIDTDGNQQTLSSDQYLVDTVHGCLYPAYGVTWPSVRSQYNAVIVEHVAGYGANATDVPNNVLEAIKFLVAHWENYQPGIEGARITTIPYAVEQLLRPERDFRGAF